MGKELTFVIRNALNKHHYSTFSGNIKYLLMVCEQISSLNGRVEISRVQSPNARSVRISCTNFCPLLMNCMMSNVSIVQM